MLLQTIASQFFIPIIILLGISTLTSILINLFKLKFLPTFAIEIVLGLIISGWFNGFVEDNDMTNIVNGIYILGLVLIMFLTGYDVDFDVFDDFDTDHENHFEDQKHHEYKKSKNVNIFKTTVLITVMTYATSIVVSLFFSNSIGGNKFLAVILMTLIFASTFAGLVVPLIHNEGLSHTVIGKLLAAISNLSEALSILFLTIFMIATDVDPAYWIVVLLIAVLIITLMIIKKYKFGKAFSKITEGIDHFATRIVIVVILGLVILSDMSGGEYILGAFIAGILVHQADFSEDIIHSLSRVIYGIFAPMFFILVGTRIDIMNYIREPESLLMVLYIFIGLLACELPVLYLLKWYKMNTVAPSMLLLSCTIVVPIAANHINDALKLYNEEFADALILASLLLCVFGTILFQINFPFGNFKKSHEYISEDK